MVEISGKDAKTFLETLERHNKGIFTEKEQKFYSEFKRFHAEIHKKDAKNIYTQAITKWGKVHQIRIAVEECAELIVELSKYEREVNGTDMDKIATEIADVQNMTDMLKVLFDIDDLVNKKRADQLEKLYNMLHTGDNQ